MADTARAVERLGYLRYWIAEHHNMRSLACSATEVLVAHAAAATERIRVGSGGVMLGNHTPLQVAERYQTLEALHAGRIDLGIGRAPGTDPVTSRALLASDPARFASDLAEMIALSEGTLAEEHPFRRVRVVPDDAPLPPVYLLGSSGASARFAGGSGFGYGFAGHFGTAPAAPALLAYREAFQPSRAFPVPRAILALTVVCAQTDEEARRLAEPQALHRVLTMQGIRKRLPTPEEAAAHPWTREERRHADAWLDRFVVGDPGTVKAELERRAGLAEADEVMLFTSTWDPADRIRTFERVAEAFGL